MLTRIIFYDAAGKTGGIVSRAFDHGRVFLCLLRFICCVSHSLSEVQNIIHRAQTVVNNCTCADGCQLCERLNFELNMSTLTSKWRYTQSCLQRRKPSFFQTWSFPHLEWFIQKQGA